MRMGRWLLLGQLAIGMAIFGSGTPISKIVTNDFPVFSASMLRMLIAALILVPFAFWGQRFKISDIERSDWIRLTVIALVGMVGFSVFMLLGMKQVSGTVGSIVMSTTPAVTALASFIILHEEIGWRRLLGIGLAVMGLLILHVGNITSSFTTGYSLLGVLFVFAAVCSETTYTLVGRSVSKNLDPLKVACISSLIAVVLFSPFALQEIMQNRFVIDHASSILALIWWGLGTMALGTALWYGAIKRVKGSTAAGFMGIMPISALILSYLLLGEKIIWTQLLGFGVVFSGVILISLAHMREADNS